jgi:hypothetical protein
MSAQLRTTDERQGYASSSWTPTYNSSTPRLTLTEQRIAEEADD